VHWSEPDKDFQLGVQTGTGNFRVSKHRVQFYDSDEFLVKKVLEFIEPARRSGDGVVVIADRDHLESIRALLHLQPCESTHDCVLLDARDALATFMVDGLPDKKRFDEVIGGLIRHVSRNGGKHVSAYGEMVAVLYAEGNAAAAVQLEQLWEQLAQRHRFSLLCAYPLSAFPDDAHRHAFECICAAHSQVDPLERFDAVKEPHELHRTMALLQQRADALEGELRQRQSFEQLLESQKAQIETLVAAQAALEKLAGQDPLTGLANRRIFNDRLAHAVERATRTGNPLALVFIDIDDFKALNDTHGHAAGDYLLKQIAARLSLCVRTADTVCRWGGDEFAIITENADIGQARILMQRIVASLSDTFVVGGATIKVSASVGISHYPSDATHAQALVENADAAMYHAKRSNKNPSSAAQPTPNCMGQLAAA
jgi:diguanylate cyclase (GGDEF)-like protein